MAENNIEWKAVIEFNGTVEQYDEFRNNMNELLQRHPIEVYIPEWVCCNRPYPGGMPLPIDVMIPPDTIEGMIEEVDPIELNYIDDIFGGMRNPHIHYNDLVYQLDLNTFKQMATAIAGDLGGRRVEVIEDYVDAMDDILRLAESNPLPA
jgi:hypothetical protein